MKQDHEELEVLPVASFTWEEGPVPRWRLEGWGDGAAAVCSARFGPGFAGNMGLHVGDDPGRVIANRQTLAAAMGFSLEDSVWAQQVHGGRIARVGAAQRGAGARNLEGTVAGVDGLFTRDEGVLLAGVFADCVPLFFWHEAGWIGLAHAGWRGTAEGIGLFMAEVLAEAGGSLDALHVAIGPAIGGCCYPVGQEVRDELSRRYSWAGEWLGPSVDLPALHREAFLRMGIASDRVSGSGVCTSCQVERAFSYRKEGGKTGRMVAAIGISRKSAMSSESFRSE